MDEGVSIEVGVVSHGAYAEQLKLLWQIPLEIKAHPDFVPAKELATADALILMGSDRFARLYYKYVLPPDRAIYDVRAPILVYGPQGIEPVEYALRGDWSLCVTTGRQADEGGALGRDTRIDG